MKKKWNEKKCKLKRVYYYEKDCEASDPVNKKSNLPAKDIDLSQHNVSNIHYEELLTEEKSTDN